MNTNPIEIVFAATGDYAPFVATAALSIIEHTDKPVRFHVMVEKFDTEDKVIIQNFLSPFPNASIEFVDLDEQMNIFDGLQLCWFKSYIGYARILIPRLFNFPKALYMDVDIIVQCDIKELWNNDFHHEGKEYAIAAIKGVVNSAYSKRLGLSPEHLYFNNGILLLNCVKWQKDNIAQDILRMAKETKLKFICPDQDALNIFFDDNNYIPVSGPYNSSPENARDKSNFNPKIIHYETKKPWVDATYFKAEVFWEYAKKTPYYEHLLYKLENKMWDKEKRNIDLSQFAILARKQLRNS
jgi:lipopolysaccharide biosynthesis glycosyltransferase